MFVMNFSALHLRLLFRWPSKCVRGMKDAFWLVASVLFLLALILLGESVSLISLWGKPTIYAAVSVSW